MAAASSGTKNGLVPETALRMLEVDRTPNPSEHDERTGVMFCRSDNETEQMPNQDSSRPGASSSVRGELVTSCLGAIKAAAAIHAVTRG